MAYRNTDSKSNSDWQHSEDNDPFSRFSRYAKLKSRTERLAQYESEYLLSFFSDHLQCFQISALNNARVSVTSTCNILDLILKNKQHWKTHASWEGTGIENAGEISLKKVVASLMETKWSYDSFQTPTLVKTLSTVKPADMTEAGKEKFTRAVGTVLEQRSRLSRHRQQTQSSYLRYYNVMALVSLMENPSMIPEKYKDTQDIPYAIERANLVAYDELSRQLAFHFAGDSSDFDVIILAFSLLAYYESSESSRGGTKQGSGVVGKANMQLTKTALEVIFNHQFKDGTWRKGEAIQIKMDSSSSSTGKRDIGNSYVYFFDIVSAIIRTLPQEILMPYIPNFERCLVWAENNVQKEMPPLDCDEDGYCQGPIIVGWKSNHVADPTTTSWSTASVFNFLDEFKDMLSVAQTRSVLNEFGGKSKEVVLQETGGRESWGTLMDADINEAKGLTLKNTLFDKVLLPQLQKEIDEHVSMLAGGRDDVIKNMVAGDEEGERVMPASLLRQVQTITTNPTPLYSLILFGPPGTAKTSIAMSLAAVINYNFVTIDTATFLADGMENVANRMSYVFDRLKGMSDTVILFDEIEEFCLDRENPNLAMESRMLTTAMLTQLNALRRDQKNIFIVATNRLRSFDAAVIRPGRFDLLAFVGTPNYSARETRLRKRLLASMTTIGATHQDVDDAMKIWSGLMKSNWDESTRFLTFAENEALNADVVSMLARKSLNVESLKAKIADIEATSTIQGQVRQEYIESEGLSRW